ncbi:MAG: Hpt domain-containing protein [Glaciecola sp.]
MTRAQNLVDIDFALSQLAGNTDLLSRMLTRFEQEFSSVPLEVNTLIDAGDLQQAKMKVHTTKGISGNLGLMALFECSKVLDEQLRGETIDTEQLALFTTLMRDTCAFVSTLDLTRSAPPEFTPDNNNNDFISEFIERLERHEFIDDATLHKYINSLNVDDASKRNLVSLVEELQYSEAIKIIKSI